MTFRTSPLIASAALFGLTLALSTSAQAQALTSSECSAKYQAAKTAGTLGAQNYAAFRRAQCSAAAQPAAAQPAAATANPLRPAPAARTAPAAAPAAAAAGSAVFPRAVDAKYSTLRPAQQRLKTCSDQYNANKTTNGNGGMKWIEKGGGYWSACNKAIKS